MTLPEERELSQKTQELHRLETELAERELTLATLQAQVRDFEQDYLRREGRLYAALDEVTAELAALELREHPGSAEFERAAHESRARAERSAQEAAEASEERGKPLFKASLELSKLYRMLAKLAHPDLCAEPKDRERRTRFMAEVNAAYQAGDEARLRASTSVPPTDDPSSLARHLDRPKQPQQLQTRYESAARRCGTALRNPGG